MSHISSNGYVRNGSKYVHRETMQAFLKRTLSKTEHVHHKNGDKRDNRIENLEVLNESAHHKLHWKGIGIDQELLRRLVSEGKSFNCIAKLMKRPYSTVQVAARRMGLNYALSQHNRQRIRARKCLWCGEDFLMKYNNAGKYCSRTCMWSYRRENPKG